MSAGLRILKYPDKLLRKKAASVKSVGPEELGILAEMAETMYMSKGVGLAATQVGIDKQLAVIDVGEGLINIVNPVIVKTDGSETEEEGCLSVPETAIKIKRAKTITVNFMDEAGEIRHLNATGLLARAFQHEIDHLHGKLIVDYLNPIKKMLIKRRRSGHKPKNI